MNDAELRSPEKRFNRSFDRDFELLTGYSPMRWQTRLFEHFLRSDLPSAISIPTGLGKTAVMAIWLIGSLETESWRVFKWLKKRAETSDKIPDDDRTMNELKLLAEKVSNHAESTT